MAKRAAEDLGFVITEGSDAAIIARHYRESPELRKLAQAGRGVIEAKDRLNAAIRDDQPVNTDELTAADERLRKALEGFRDVK